MSYVKIKKRLDEPCLAVVRRDVDVNVVTDIMTHFQSDMMRVEDLKDALAS